MAVEKAVNRYDIDQGICADTGSNAFDQGISIQLLAEKSRISLRLRENCMDAFSEASGIMLPSSIGCFEKNENERILRLGPDEWLCITPTEEAAALIEKCARFSASPYSLVDISHRNVGLWISGEGAAQLINMGCPLDLALDAFPSGRCTRTVFERAEFVLLRETETEFHIEVWRSFAPYLMSLLEKGRQP